MTVSYVFGEYILIQIILISLYCGSESLGDVNARVARVHHQPEQGPAGVCHPLTEGGLGVRLCGYQPVTPGHLPVSRRSE